ncbi:SDR family oxidoreductase [Novosphingobium gossypii]|uniref:SDR family oxidoreductase n=1 Tax=Novosphingobium gossypii TaxID=1604774 RepID=UPI003D25BFAB
MDPCVRAGVHVIAQSCLARVCVLPTLHGASALSPTRRPAIADADSRRTAVITGASSGIGQATAHGFARKGWDLVLAARSEDDLSTVASQCRALNARVLAVPTDVTDTAAVIELGLAARAFAGRIDVWFSNVGVGAVGRFLDVPMDTHEQIVRANLIGHMNDAHVALPIFIGQGKGVFVNMISLGGFAAAPYAAAYFASKFGLRGFSEALRAELSDHRGVHLCDVYPAFVDTPAMGHAGNHSGKRLSAPPPLLDPRRVADAVVRLADHPRNSVYVGAPNWPARIGHFISPSLSGRAAKAAFDRYFAKAPGAEPTDGNVHAPPGDGARIDGGLRQPSSPVARVGMMALATAGLVAAGGALWHRRQRR